MNTIYCSILKPDLFCIYLRCLLKQCIDRENRNSSSLSVSNSDVFQNCCFIATAPHPVIILSCALKSPLNYDYPNRVFKVCEWVFMDSPFATLATTLCYSDSHSVIIRKIQNHSVLLHWTLAVNQELHLALFWTVEAIIALLQSNKRM